MSQANETPKQHVVVVGAGLLGTATAYYLARNGFQVTVVEQKSDAAQGTSHANAGALVPSVVDIAASPANAKGMLKSTWKSVKSALGMQEEKVEGPSLHDHPAQKVKWGDNWPLIPWGMYYLRNSTPWRYSDGRQNLYQLARFSHALTLKMMAEHDMNIEHRFGLLKLYEDEKNLEKHAIGFKHLEKLGAVGHHLTREECLAKEPYLAQLPSLKFAGGVWFPHDFSADSRKFVLNLASITEKQYGVKYLFNTRAKNLQVATTDSKISETVSNGTMVEKIQAYMLSKYHRVKAKLGLSTPDLYKVTGVETDQGVVPADAVVLCLGPWTSHFLKQIDSPLTPPVVGMKGHSFTLPHAPAAGGPSVCMTVAESNVYVTPFESRYRVTFGTDFVGMDWSLDKTRTDYLRANVHKFFPNTVASNLPIGELSPWSGLRPMSPDGLPIIGKMPAFSNVFLNAGQGTIGWTLACGSGHVVSQSVLASSTSSSSPSTATATSFEDVSGDFRPESFRPSRFGLLPTLFPRSFFEKKSN